jgi:hypothetical protein
MLTASLMNRVDPATKAKKTLKNIVELISENPNKVIDEVVKGSDAADSTFTQILEKSI